jgi:molybdenum cofactor biosynthesis enzyme MoaA
VGQGLPATPKVPEANNVGNIAEAEMRNEECAECTRLRRRVTGAFEKFVKLTSAQLEAFRSNEDHMFVRLEEAVKTAADEKEMAIGALRQHQEHGHK